MSDTQQIKDKIDVVELIGEYVQLKPAGVNHKGLCPFHREKSPSFMVTRERQGWHCFGCGKGGDIFTFVQEIEGMEFVEALRFLAQRAGIELTGRVRNEVEMNEKNRIKNINAKAAYFFHNVLAQMEAAKDARSYLEKRGLTTDTIEEWQVGFVPDQWDLLTKYLLSKGCAIEDIVASGLTIKKDNASGSTGRGYYDRFRGRIMFPIWDVQGDVVGFTGRILVETETSGGKYVNTPQTPVFDKSRIVFALNKARQAIKQAGYSVLVEGQMDVIACHQAGMYNVVASSGTALTEEQVKMLERYGKTIRMAFDADEAGQNAAKRGIDIALEAGLEVKIIQIPEDAGKDPDDCIKKDKAVWMHAVEHAVDVMRWYFDRAFKGKDLTSPRQKQEIANTLLAEIVRIPYAVERDHWLQELSHRLMVDVEVLREDIKRILNGRKASSYSGKELPRAPESQKKPEPPKPVSRLDALVEQIFILLWKLKTIDKELFISLPHPILSTSLYAPLYERLRLAYSISDKIVLDDLRHALTPSLDTQINHLLLKGEWGFFATIKNDEALIRKEIQPLVDQIRKEYMLERRKVLHTELEKAEKSGQGDRVTEIIKELQQLV